jgi:GNAT superfamily N-acetyltransferase
VREIAASSLSPGYRIQNGAPQPTDYVQLRLQSGLSPKTEDQAKAAVSGSWAACHVVHTAEGRCVAMGRVIGDGGWYFHIVDMAVLPQHQRRGLGSAVLVYLLEQIRHRAPHGAYVSLLADAPGRHLYARSGFVESAPGSVGMVLTLD